MLRLTVLVAALLGQTVYTWTDKNGEEHFTDDPSSIPKGVKAKTMQPGEVETVRSSDEPSPSPTAAAPLAAAPLAAADAGAPDAGLPEDTCEKARKAIAQAQAALDAAKKAAVTPSQRNCQEALNTLGPMGYAQCMNRSPDAKEGERQVASAQRRLDDAKDDLRRAQAAGCR